MPPLQAAILLALAGAARRTTARQLTRRSLADYPLAVCNDGSAATYHHSSDLASSRILINLQGGGWCGTEQSCKHRCQQSNPYLCTADNQPTMEMKERTMWSSDPEVNPAFHDFGQIFVHYCSSDVYTGTRNASQSSGGYFFHGRHIVSAVVEDIIRHKPNVETMEQLVFIGESAGAFGVSFNCDTVAERFHQVNPGLDVRCIADAGDFYPPLLTAPDKPQCDNYQAEALVMDFWQAEGDTSCTEEAANPLDCLMFPSYYSYIHTPFMVVAHYIDTTVHGFCAPGLQEEPEFWQEWEEEVYSLAVRYITDKPDNALFLSNCPFHVSVGQDWAWGEMDVPLVGGEGETILYKDIVTNWINSMGPYQAMDPPLQKNTKCPF